MNLINYLLSILLFVFSVSANTEVKMSNMNDEMMDVYSKFYEHIKSGSKDGVIKTSVITEEAVSQQTGQIIAMFASIPKDQQEQGLKKVGVNSIDELKDVNVAFKKLILPNMIDHYPNAKQFTIIKVFNNSEDTWRAMLGKTNGKSHLIYFTKKDSWKVNGTNYYQKGDDKKITTSFGFSLGYPMPSPKEKVNFLQEMTNVAL